MYDSPNLHVVPSLFLLLHMLVIWQQYHKMAEDQNLKIITNKLSVSDENIKTLNQNVVSFCNMSAAIQTL